MEWNLLLLYSFIAFVIKAKDKKMEFIFGLIIQF